MAALVAVENLSRKYGDVDALRDLSMEVESGQRVAVLGCNGAGKSTFMSLLTGQIRPTGGMVRLFGEDPREISVRSRFRYLPQELKFPENLKVRELVKIVEGQLGSLLDPQILERLELDQLLNQYCHSLSGGELRKLSVAMSLTGQARLLILDEPTSNIDIVHRHRIYQLLGDYLDANKTSILFSSHELSEVEKLATRVIVLHKGRAVADGSLEEIQRRFSSTRIEFHSAMKSLPEMVSIRKVKMENGQFTLHSQAGDETLRELLEKVPDASRISVRPSGLEEAFLNIWEGRQ